MQKKTIQNICENLYENLFNKLYLTEKVKRGGMYSI